MRDTEEYPGADRGHGRDHPVARVMVVDHWARMNVAPVMVNGQNADRCRYRNRPRAANAIAAAARRVGRQDHGISAVADPPVRRIPRR